MTASKRQRNYGIIEFIITTALFIIVNAIGSLKYSWLYSLLACVCVIATDFLLTKWAGVRRHTVNDVTKIASYVFAVSLAIASITRYLSQQTYSLLLISVTIFLLITLLCAYVAVVCLGFYTLFENQN